jgi:hypothetical protein
MSVTHTRTHVFVTTADPYLLCAQCREWATGYHDGARCGCDEPGWQNQPCGHQAEMVTACPSWGPVDGCRCITHGGQHFVKHAIPPDEVAAGKPL